MKRDCLLLIQFTTSKKRDPNLCIPRKWFVSNAFRIFGWIFVQAWDEYQGHAGLTKICEIVPFSGTLCVVGSIAKTLVEFVADAEPGVFSVEVLKESIFKLGFFFF